MKHNEVGSPPALGNFSSKVAGIACALLRVGKRQREGNISIVGYKRTSANIPVAPLLGVLKSVSEKLPENTPLLVSPSEA